MSVKPRGKGTRYSDEEKTQVLDFVSKVHAEKGRGGITAAAVKFNVTPLTISNWLRKTGAVAVSSVRRGAQFSTSLRRLADLHEAIIKKEPELAALKREYMVLKMKL